MRNFFFTPVRTLCNRILSLLSGFFLPPVGAIHATDVVTRDPSGRPFAEGRPLPSLLFISIPPLDLLFSTAKWAKRLRIKSTVKNIFFHHLQRPPPTFFLYCTTGTFRKKAHTLKNNPAASPYTHLFLQLEKIPARVIFPSLLPLVSLRIIGSFLLHGFLKSFSPPHSEGLSFYSCYRRDLPNSHAWSMFLPVFQQTQITLVSRTPFLYPSVFVRVSPPKSGHIPSLDQIYDPSGTGFSFFLPCVEKAPDYYPFHRLSFPFLDRVKKWGKCYTRNLLSSLFPRVTWTSRT